MTEVAVNLTLLRKLMRLRSGVHCAIVILTTWAPMALAPAVEPEGLLFAALKVDDAAQVREAVEAGAQLGNLFRRRAPGRSPR